MTKGKGKRLTKEERQEFLKIQEVLKGRIFYPKIIVMPGIIDLIEKVKFQSGELIFEPPVPLYMRSRQGRSITTSPSLLMPCISHL